MQRVAQIYRVACHILLWQTGLCAWRAAELCAYLFAGDCVVNVVAAAFAVPGIYWLRFWRGGFRLGVAAFAAVLTERRTGSVAN